jgi:hypothetical protein
VPKRCFGTAEDIPRLRRMLETNFRGKLCLLAEP